MENIIFSINERVKELIEAKNLSIKEVAEAIGILPTNLSRMLGGEDLKVSTVMKIAKTLDLPVSVFFEEFDKDLPPAHQKIDVIYEKLHEMWEVIVKQKETDVSVVS
jgi:transcriptional regulator with XRE-family HTH domain